MYLKWKGYLDIMPTLSPLYDIKSLIEHYALIDVVGRPATVHGVLEYHSNCPRCGGHDRFITRPETGQFTCATRASGCGWHGDCKDFLRDYCNMSHSEACDVLGLEVNGEYVPSKPSQNIPSGKEQPPCKAWQDIGKDLVERAASVLWSPAGKDMLDYLHGRGLGDEIIKKKKLGYVPKLSNGSYFESELKDWGLDPGNSSKDKVRIPDGILIPWFYGSELWRLAIKRPGKEQSYGQVLGSGEGLYNVNTVQYEFPVMIVEGEICCLSVEQEAGDLIACVATGSTTRGRLARWVSELNLASCILQSFDEDDSGDSGAEYWLEHLEEKCQRWSPLIAKDPNDILMQKFFPDRGPHTLREWIEAGLMSMRKIDVPTPEPPIPLARGNEPVQKYGRGVEIDLSRTQWHGPDVDLNALTIKEQLHNSFTPMAFLNSKCPCGCGRFR